MTLSQQVIKTYQGPKIEAKHRLDLRVGASSKTEARTKNPQDAGKDFAKVLQEKLKG
jgi:hypothetical protein